jgi:thioredoxin-like negative regulator of GroEL
MKHFWQGFSSKTASSIQFKKHVIVLFWSPENEASKDTKGVVSKLTSKYPSVKVKLVNIKKDATKPERHKVTNLPTVLLLREGREVDRLESGNGSATFLEQLFRKAHT